ncbi:MAG TPA: hypothetical protein VKM55_30890 [Candidatus Lokiarchaeia archaeon]|nr:hypothetical protein [Candidatus Lokiarchaeia archaeon]
MQIKVLFEEKYFYSITDKALRELVKEGKIINWIETREHQDPIDEKKTIKMKHSLFCSLSAHYFKRRVKSLLDKVEFFSTDQMNKAVGEWGEHAVEFMLLKFKFDIEGKHTNEFQGKKWTKTKNDLDFIASKDGVTYGIEVKNSFDDIPDPEFNIKVFGICPYLGIIPVCIFRFTRYDNLTKIKQVNGRVFVFVSKLFPTGLNQQVRAFWNETLLPIQTAMELPEKTRNQFIEWHESNVEKKLTESSTS